MIRDYKIGQVVEISKSRDDYYDKMPPTWEVPQGWRGTIIKQGVTPDGLYYAYDLQGEDGTILENYPSSCILPVVPGSNRSIAKIIGNITFSFAADSVEKEELEIALDYIQDYWGRGSRKSLMHIAYEYGKTVGIRAERQRKKTLSEEKI